MGPETVGELCEALAHGTPPSVTKALRQFDLDHQADDADLLTPTLRSRYVPGPGLSPARGLLRGESVMPDVPEDWLVVSGEIGGLDTD